MKPLKTILRYFILFAFVIVVIVVLYTRHLKQRSLPDYTESLSFEMLSDSVKIYRDAMGIPHIYANNEADLYFATGYIMAQERLWQMDLLRRVTQGRLAEIFGGDFIDTDLLLRSLRFEKRSEEILKKLSSEEEECLKAYAEGINTYITASSKKLPFEFKLLGYTPAPWEPTHTLNLIGYMAWDLKAGWHVPALADLQKKLDSTRFAALLPDSSLQKTVCFPDSINLFLAENLQNIEKLGLDVFCGSNTWAVSGDRSESGKPLLANDMHLGFAVPGIWFQMHQCIPGKLNVSGLAIPGAHLIVVGHNDSIAWGMTNTYVDNLDFYEEKVNTNDSSLYLYQGNWLPFTYQEETIHIKGGGQVKRQLTFSHRGPVVSNFKDIKNKVITMHWVGDEPGNEISSIYQVNRAHNWSEFKQAMRNFKSISQNISYADTRGNIGLYACAGVPIRNREITIGILPGETDKFDWRGMLPFKELPHTYNPVSGEVSAANNRTTTDNYPHFIGSYYAKPYRIDRIRELLGNTPKHSINTFSAMQNDSYSKLAELFLSNAFTYINEESLSKPEKEHLETLKNWSNVMDKNLAAPMLFEKWAYNFILLTTRDEIEAAEDSTIITQSRNTKNLSYHLMHNPNSVWFDNINTGEKGSPEMVYTQSFQTTINQMIKYYGKDTLNWKWGLYHQLTMEHPLASVEALNKAFHLNIGPMAVNGSFHTVAPYSFEYFHPEKVVHGASHRNIYNLANWDSSYTVIPAGNSGQAASKFYRNQTRLYIDGNYHHDWFSEKAVKENANYVQVYSPR